MQEYDISTLFPIDQAYTFCAFKYQRWYDQSFSYRIVPRPEHGILYVVTGRIRFDFHGGDLTAIPGDVVFLPKHSCYEALIEADFGETRDYLINFDFSPSVSVSQPMKLMHTAGSWLPELCRGMLEKKLAGERCPLWFQGQLYLLLDRLQREDIPEQRAEKARRLLTEAPEMSVAQIAKACGISESCLRSQFQKTYNCSPQQYRTGAKLRRAKFLLESTDQTVAQIAEQLLYYDEAYFCKFFRQLVGCSPNQYRCKKAL